MKKLTLKTESTKRNNLISLNNCKQHQLKTIVLQSLTEKQNKPISTKNINITFLIK